MARKTIIQKGDAILTKKCHPVSVFDKKLHHLLNDLKDTLLSVGGVGLAAPQIGILRRVVIVIDANDQILELVNPELMETSGEQDGPEGCLSLPGMYGFVTRPMDATVRAQDRNGEFFTVSGSGIVARCFCHELEHLDGHMFDEHTDRLYNEKQLDEILDEDRKKES
ncbi:MAG: peptide deformylase [Evtepia sp.]|jgi:peptide deformylase|nr:peptide deformylase [Evtepia sp.]